jgi:hypothetical protein
MEEEEGEEKGREGKGRGNSPPRAGTQVATRGDSCTDQMTFDIYC